MDDNALKPNELAFIALANEFCHATENAAATSDADGFVRDMLRLLPRLYITASDLNVNAYDDGIYISGSLTEDTYNAVRGSIEALLGSEDTFLDVMEEDMKYSDTPIGASIAEHLSDIYQVMYNFLETVRDATDELTQCALRAVKEDFEDYWSQKLCNVLRPLNGLYFGDAFKE